MPSPDRWLELTLRLAPDDRRRGTMGEGLIALGGLGVLEDEVGLTTFLPPPAIEPEAFIREAALRLSDVDHTEPAELSWRWQADQDWEREWRRGLQPRKVSPRLVVKPSWTSWPAQAGEIVIDIDPQMAFGTGEHATTRGCLRLLDASLRRGDRVLDVGSGSGILAIAAARLGAARVIAVESDPDANLNARENISRNAVEHLIELREAIADPHLLAALRPFDLILANILSGVIRPLLPAFAAALRPGGRLILSGILQAESAVLLKEAVAAGLVLAAADREEEWWSGLLTY